MYTWFSFLEILNRNMLLHWLPCHCSNNPCLRGQQKEQLFPQKAVMVDAHFLLQVWADMKYSRPDISRFIIWWISSKAPNSHCWSWCSSLVLEGLLCKLPKFIMDETMKCKDTINICTIIDIESYMHLLPKYLLTYQRLNWKKWGHV